MREREPHAFGMVGADECVASPADADVDAHVRDRAGPKVGDERVAPVDPDQDGRVEAMVEAELDRLEEQCLVVRPREPARDRGQDGPEEKEGEVAMSGVVADDDGYELGALREEASGGPGGAVANAPG